MGSFMTFVLDVVTRKIKYTGDNIKMYLRNSLCCTREVECVEKSRKREGWRPLRIPRPRRGIILKCILEIQLHGIDWIYLVQDRDQWQSFLDTAINHVS